MEKRQVGRTGLMIDELGLGGGPLGGGHRAHVRLVAVLDVGVHHVEVPLVDRHVDRFADRATTVVQMGQVVDQLHGILEVLDGAVPATVVEVEHER